MFRVIKRDGSEVELNLEKISGAIVKAFDATGSVQSGNC